jgi:hypothetical protein
LPSFLRGRSFLELGNILCNPRVIETDSLDELFRINNILTENDSPLTHVTIFEMAMTYYEKALASVEEMMRIYDRSYSRSVLEVEVKLSIQCCGA